MHVNISLYADLFAQVFVSTGFQSFPHYEMTIVVTQHCLHVRAGKPCIRVHTTKETMHVDAAESPHQHSCSHRSNQHNANTGLLPFEFLISKAVGFLYTTKCCC